jgi:hypothetical protein
MGTPPIKLPALSKGLLNPYFEFIVTSMPYGMRRIKGDRLLSSFVITFADMIKPCHAESRERNRLVLFIM